ncbi:MAG: Sapep family Mn(2+)-dependent dipeptidase, partial [Clostridia bacterium]
MEIKKYIDLEFEKMLDSLDRLIRIPSIGGGAEGDAPFGKAALKALEEVLNIAASMGFSVRNFENRVGIIDLFAGTEPAIGILCHADVVPAGGNWIHDPYRATLDGENIYGRGAIDDKGPLISVLYAMKYLKEHCPRTKHNVRLIVGTDEERGSQDLAYYREREKLPPIVFTPDANYPVINTEKGRAVVSFGKQIVSSFSNKKILSASGGAAVNAVPERASAVVSGFTMEDFRRAEADSPSGIRYDFTMREDGISEISACGKSAHASLPETGANAVTGLISFLSHLDPAWG